jgi:branched-chain amino acid transport system substrate-binding protein
MFMRATHSTRLPRRGALGLACALALGLATTVATTAQAQIKVGVTVSATGPAASLGVPERDTIALLPTTIAGQKVSYIVLDDGSDTTQAVTNTRKFVTEENVDVVIGSTITPTSLAMINVVSESRTPMISLAASAAIISPIDDKRRWVFKTPQDDIQMATAIGSHMANRGIRRVAFIGFSDAYGEGWLAEFSKVARIQKLEIVAIERYNRTDTSVTGQVLKALSTKPDAVLIVGAGTPAALPHKSIKERGYTGQIYQTHGVANNDFLRVGGKDLEGAFLPAGPVVVARQLPASNPVRASAMAYVERYEAAHGKGSVASFGAHAWDAGLVLQKAIPTALAKAKPGTAEFRAALRDAIEGTRDLVGAHGVFNMSPTDHLGLDQRARVMVTVKDGAWRYVPE